MFGLDAKKEKDKQEIQKPQAKYDVKYMGGHKAYPVKKQKDATLLLFVDRIEIQSDKFLFNIPFVQMTNIENMVEKNISRQYKVVIFSAIKHACEMNDVILNWKKLKNIR